MSAEPAASPGEDASASSPTAKLFLGGLSWDTTEEKLRDHFGKYGSIVEAVVMRDRQTGRPRGFGFVTFTAPEAADSVVKDIHIIDGRQIDAKKSVPQEMKPKARKVFVGGLSPDTTDDQFREYFSQFGEVVEAQIMLDHMSGRSRGFGFVTFAEDASAENVFAAGTMHDLGGKKVEVKPATPKGSGSLARPGGSSGPQPGRPGAPPGGSSSGGARQLPPFGGGGSGGMGVFGSPPGPYNAGFGMYGFAPPGMMPAGPPFSMQYGGMGGMGALPSPYMMMSGMAQMGQMGGYAPGSAAYGFPASPGMPAPAFPPQGGGGGGAPRGGAQPTPFGQQQHAAQQQQQHPQHYPQQQYPRPLRMMSRNGSRGTGKVDSASSLEQNADVAAVQVPAGGAPTGPAVAEVQEQLGKVALAD